MPSMKWIKEKTNEFLQLEHNQVQNNLDLARFNREIDIVSELVLWLEAKERMDKMAKKMKKETKSHERHHTI